MYTIYLVLKYSKCPNNSWPNGFAGVFPSSHLASTNRLPRNNINVTYGVRMYVCMYKYIDIYMIIYDYIWYAYIYIYITHYLGKCIHLLGVSGLTPWRSFTVAGYPDGAGFPANCACFLCLRNNETSRRHHLYQQMHEAGTQLNQFEHENWTLRRTLNPKHPKACANVSFWFCFPSIIWY